MDNDFTPSADPEEVKTKEYKNKIVLIMFNLDQTFSAWFGFNTTR